MLRVSAAYLLLMASIASPMLFLVSVPLLIIWADSTHQRRVRARANACQRHDARPTVRRAQR